MEVIEKLMLETLQAQTGKTTEELQTLLYEKLEGSEDLTLKNNAKDLILELDVNRINTIKTGKDSEFEKKIEKIKNDQKGLGKKEGLQELESALLSEFEIEAKDKKGIDLVREIIKATTKSTLTADEIKRHPAYLELESKLKTEYVPKSEFDEVKSTHEQYISNQEKGKRIKKLRESALITLRGMKLKMAEDANIKANQEELFLKGFIDNLNVDIATDELILLNEDNTRKEDKHGIAIPLTKYVEQIAPTQFELLVQDPGGGSGNRNDGGGSNGTFKKPESEAEYNNVRRTLSGKDLIDYSDKYAKLFE